MNDHIRSTTGTFSFNSRIVRLGLQQLTNEHAIHQMRGGEGSSISYLVGHLLASRVGALKVLGVETENPYSEHFSPSAPASDGSEYPEIDDLARQWDEVAEKISDALGNLGDDDVLAPREGFPVADQTLRGALMFWAWHESYHVGQIGLMLTELGYPALRDRLLAQGKS